MDESGRKTFDAFLREVLREKQTYTITHHFPAKGTVYEYTLLDGSAAFVPWSDTIDANFCIPTVGVVGIQDIIVPCVDTARYTRLLELCVMSVKPCLLVGGTGTGKSVCVRQMLNNRTLLPDDQYITATLMFSAQTTCSQTQSWVDSKLDRRRKGIFGPPNGKCAVFFIDDLNMPQLEKYGAQPPIELLRQFLDYQGWYDTKDLVFRSLETIQFVAAMGTPGGGRNPVTPRFLRHFVQIAVTPFDESTLQTIYTTILTWHFEERFDFPADVTMLAEELVAATRELYHSAMRRFLPTPVKSHYTFNLRDFSNVIGGLLFSHPDNFTSGESMLRLWVHEVHRVFSDRLVDDEESLEFLGWIKQNFKQRFGESFDSVMSAYDLDGDGKVTTVNEIGGLFFGDYMVRSYPRHYKQLDGGRLEGVWAAYLSEYNSMSDKPMPLIMFRFAVQHASRIARILRQPRGNALLVGVGGSGKQSLTKLAASVMEYEVKQIELTRSYSMDDWKDDLRTILIMAGAQGRDTVFLFSDNQIKHEGFLEDINSILNSGDVPGLWDTETVSQICEMVSASYKRDKGEKAASSPDQLFQYFTEQVKMKLHVVLCMSPVGNAFRHRIRMFPSLVNCCTIDWFQPWPKEALASVARETLKEMEMEETIRDSCEQMCIMFHRNMEETAKRFLENTGRHTYVTPTSYLELLVTFQDLLSAKQQEIRQSKDRYEAGLRSIADAEEEVIKMQAELHKMQPVMVQTSKETDEMIVVVTNETKEADKIREGVAKEEEIARQAADAAKEIELDCANDLAQAMPVLEAAVAALDTLTSSELSEVKAMRNPPRAVKLVMECLCVMKNISPARVPDPAGTGRMILDYWEVSKKLVLSDPKLLKSLKEYDKDNIPPAVIKKIRKYFTMPEFDINQIKKTSRAAHSLCSWIYAIESYDRVAKLVQPKKEALARARAEYKRVKEGLDKALAELRKVEAKIATLNSNLDKMKKKKAELREKIKVCSIKLDRAKSLLGGLGGEKNRWTSIAAQLGEKYENSTGNVLVCSAVIAYVGALTSSYRSDVIQQWVGECKRLSIPGSADFNIVDILSNPVQVRGWTLDGLPNDDYTVATAVIMSQSRRWPLMIDPQEQATKWIKNMEKAHDLVVQAQTADYGNKLENAIRLGRPFLLENCGEDLDPALSPLLLKQFKSSLGVRVLKMGDRDIEYHEDFRLYITTKIANPHYLPEVAVRVALLNFMITPTGLEDQLMGVVVALDRPELEKRRTELTIARAQNEKKLKELEDEILQVLSASKGDILDDENAVQVLHKSKQVADDISRKQKVAHRTEQEINVSRQAYKPLAFHAAVLYFCVADLSRIDPMYQYSLSWFITLFKSAILSGGEGENEAVRIRMLKDHFAFLLYTAVCRSLFEQHKLLFAFFLCARLMVAERRISQEQWFFLITGGVAAAEVADMPANPCIPWLLDRDWKKIVRLSTIRKYSELGASFSSFADEWKRIYDSPAPWTMPFPGTLDDDYDDFDNLVVLSCLRPDKVTHHARQFVATHMGERFKDPPTFDLKAVFEYSSNVVPIIFILSPGSDPVSAIHQFAADAKIFKGGNNRIESISLGQGQGPIAEEMIKNASLEGDWVILQNCHLYESWFPSLQRICERFNPADVNADFRLWLTSYPSDKFPVSVLQNSIKLTMDAPSGIKANMLASYATAPVSDPEFYQSCKKTKELKTMVFALCFFHALVQERRKFGSLGWNKPYEWNLSDLSISIRQLHLFLDSVHGAIPYQALRYLIGECNYGGRVTEESDRRTLTSLLARFFTPNIHEPKYGLCSLKDSYQVPHVGPLSSYVEYVGALPDVTPTEVFGLHVNADMTKEQSMTEAMLAALLMTESSSVGSSSSGSGGGGTANLQEMASAILSKLPPAFNIAAIQAKFPILYTESMNTVLSQECQRYNRLTHFIRSSLEGLQKALVTFPFLSLLSYSYFGQFSC